MNIHQLLGYRDSRDHLFELDASTTDVPKSPITFRGVDSVEGNKLTAFQSHPAVAKQVLPTDYCIASSCL